MSMQHQIMRMALSAIFCVISFCATAAEMNITASFTPSATNPENSAFTNTTPISGYCATWPAYCAAGVWGIKLPLELRLKRPIVANDVPRNNPYFGLSNKSRTIPVVNETTGETSQVTFRLSGFSASYSLAGNDYSWIGGSYSSINAPCQNSGPLVGNSQHTSFVWKVSSADGACYKVSTIDRTEPSRFYEMSIAYELETPDPLKMSSGVYKGTAPLTVGPGGRWPRGQYRFWRCV